MMSLEMFNLGLVAMIFEQKVSFYRSVVRPLIFTGIRITLMVGNLKDVYYYGEMK